MTGGIDRRLTLRWALRERLSGRLTIYCSVPRRASALARVNHHTGGAGCYAWVDF